MTVVVTDPLCTAAPTLVSKNGDASPNSLDPVVYQFESGSRAISASVHT